MLNSGGKINYFLLLLYESSCTDSQTLVSLCLQTDYFHLFLCVAIIVLYGEDVTEQQLATDQMLLHFSNLSMHMNGELVLRKVSQLNALALFAFLQDVVTFTERVYTTSYTYSAPVCTPKHAVPPPENLTVFA